MGFPQLPCNEFVEALASKAPVPGGGGAAALVGAIGVALGGMVGSLTIGKKKYADAQEAIAALKAKADSLQAELLELVQKDADAFEPLSRAYGMPKATEAERAEKAATMAAALRECCAPPLGIMRACCEAVELLGGFAAKGSAIAVSDAGCGAACCKAALQAASLNVLINTAAMEDRKLAGELNAQASLMLERGSAKADEVFEGVAAMLRHKERD
ncbi:MAG: cyclodeaminase/cyclohydrolase family protein [Clostridiales bacterium]|jgi:formiminotetrahydrofolate cyclodeaminase|nr:cyclodeaminase/cyclohydrolase family protein [Clostridiales bacterium]